VILKARVHQIEDLENCTKENLAEETKSRGWAGDVAIKQSKNMIAAVALESLRALWTAFAATVLSWENNNIAQQSSTVPLLSLSTSPACMLLPSPIRGNNGHDNSSIETKFYLSLSNADDSVCAGSDWMIWLVLVIIVHSVSWTSRWLLWEPWYRWHHGNRHYWENLSNNDKNNNAGHVEPIFCVKDMQNFSQSCTACAFHTISAVLVGRILLPAPWLHDEMQWFHRTDTVSADFKFYYLLYAARYGSDPLSLCFKHVRADTWAYAVHHAATVALVLGSAAAGYTRLGGVLLPGLGRSLPARCQGLQVPVTTSNRHVSVYHRQTL
jgi:TLC domain